MNKNTGYAIVFSIKRLDDTDLVRHADDVAPIIVAGNEKDARRNEAVAC